MNKNSLFYVFLAWCIYPALTPQIQAIPGQTLPSNIRSSRIATTTTPQISHPGSPSPVKLQLSQPVAPNLVTPQKSYSPVPTPSIPPTPPKPQDAPNEMNINSKRVGPPEPAETPAQKVARDLAYAQNIVQNLTTGSFKTALNQYTQKKTPENLNALVTTYLGLFYPVQTLLARDFPQDLAYLKTLNQQDPSTQQYLTLITTYQAPKSSKSGLLSLLQGAFDALGQVGITPASSGIPGPLG